MSFFDSIHCTSGVHCARCRLLEGGRAWRESLSGVHGDTGGADFECPHGKEWIDLDLGGDAGVGDTLARALEKTGVGRAAKAAIKAVTGKSDCGCKKRQEALNKAAPYDSRPVVLVMRRTTNRKEVLDTVRDALCAEFNAQDIEVPFTLAGVRKAVGKWGNVVAIIRAEEHGRLFVNKNWKEVCGWAHEQSIQMLHVDFGYYDHYNSRLIGEYGPDGEPVMEGWGERSKAPPQYILDHFEKCIDVANRSRAEESPYPFPYVVFWTGCHAALARKGFRHKKPEWLAKACGEALERCLLPVIKDGGLGSLEVPPGVEFVQHRDMAKNARLAVHAHNNIIVNSSVSNELALWGVPVTALGRSWYDGKGVFYEAESWLDAIDPQPVDADARLDWMAWWVNHQCHKDDFPAEILRRVKDGNRVLGGHR